MSEDSMKSEKRSRLTDVAPHRSFVKRVICPRNGVNELVEAGQGGPEHVKAGPGIPSLKVPWKGYQYQDESEE